MDNKIEKFNQSGIKANIPEIKTGDTVSVVQIIKDKDKDRTQALKGVVIARKHGKGLSAAITVRSIVSGVGVEKVFPIHSPMIAKIEVLKKGKARRSKLYYLRTAKGKRGQIKGEFAEAIAAKPAKKNSAPASQTPEAVATEKTEVK